MSSVPHLVASSEAQTSWFRRDRDLARRSGADAEPRAAACAWNWRGLVWFDAREEAAEEEEAAAAVAMNAIELNSETAARRG